jgi:hypothetical protein
MTERPQDDLTRDITLPPLPGRAPSVLPRQWASLDRSLVQPPPTSSSPADQSTDRLEQPERPPREQTLAFGTPQQVERAAGRPPHASSTAPPRRSRRWPWVVLSLVPLLVIAGAGVMLAVLLHGG